jgi:hypothetical protein
VKGYEVETDRLVTEFKKAVGRRKEQGNLTIAALEGSLEVPVPPSKRTQRKPAKKTTRSVRARRG